MGVTTRIKTVHGERFVLSRGKTVVGIKAVSELDLKAILHRSRQNAVRISTYRIHRADTSLNLARRTSSVKSYHPRRQSKSNQWKRAFNDAEHKVEKSMRASDDTGIQAAELGVRVIRNGNKVLWNSYRFGGATIKNTRRAFTVSREKFNAIKNHRAARTEGARSTIIPNKGASIRPNKKVDLTGAGGARRTLLKTPIRHVQKNSVKAVKNVRGIGTSVLQQGSEVLTNSNDIGCQSVVAGSKFVKYGFKTSKTAVKTSYKVGRTTVRATKASLRFVKSAKQNGLKKTTLKTFKKAQKKLGDKVRDMLLNLGKKLIFNPYTLIIVIVTGAAGGMVVAGGAVAAAIPGGVIEVVENVVEGLKAVYEKVKDTIVGVAGWIANRLGIGGGETEVDVNDSISVEEYLLGAVALYREDIVNNMYSKQQEYIDTDYHVVKIKNLYGAEARAELANVDRAFIESSVISTEAIVEIIMPIWNSIVLGHYGSNAGAQVMNLLTEALTNSMCQFEVVETSIETCGGNSITCLNPSETYYHLSNSGQYCCHISTSYHLEDDLGECDNIETLVTPVYEMVDGVNVQTGTIETEFCAGHSSFTCTGYTTCLGHNTVLFLVGNKTIDEILQAYFLDKIEELNNKSSLTAEEEEELFNLRQYYEFAIGLIDIYNE